MRTRLGRCFAWSGVVLLILLVLDGILLAIWWPFREYKLVQSLEHFASSDVQIRGFRRIYFPHPGYIAENLTFTRRANGQPVEIASLRKLAADASWFAMLSYTHRLVELRLEGLHVTLPARMPPPMPKHPSLKDKTTVTTLIANGSVLEMASRSTPSQSLRFVFPQLSLSNVEKSKSIGVHLSAKLPELQGDLTVRGWFGPVQGKQGNDTPLSGSFRLTQANLGAFHSIQGTLSGGGVFRGTLERCHVRGSAGVPNFELTSTGHPAGMRIRFDVLVNGRQGNISLQSADLHLMHTTVMTQGTIAGPSGDQPKTVTLTFNANRARVEDLLWIFAQAKHPALEGPITLEGKAVLPPGKEDFLRKLRLDGNFAIHGAEFEHGDMQYKVDKMSARARKDTPKATKGADPPEVLSDMKGHVSMRNGTARLSHLVFAAPGARAQGEGTYDLLTKWVDLHGEVATQASLSKDAGGLKSILLLPLDPFFKKKNAGAVLPVQIKGKFPQPAMRVSLTKKGSH